MLDTKTGRLKGLADTEIKVPSGSTTVLCALDADLSAACKSLTSYRCTTFLPAVLPYSPLQSGRKIHPLVFTLVDRVCNEHAQMALMVAKGATQLAVTRRT